jgi:hypothetical protein
MNLISTLVTIVVLGGGGPPSHQATGITNSTISIFHFDGTEKRPYATLYEGGELVLRLRPGVYSVEAHLNNATAPCESVAHLRIGHRKTARVRLECNTK